MLLLNRVVAVDDVSAQSLVFIDEEALFFDHGKGVPTWIALEYMGQTSAMIAGYQNLRQSVEPRLGFFLGTRLFDANCEYFEPESILHVRCRENALVGETLANFDCSVSLQGSNTTLASASISVFRGSDDPFSVAVTPAASSKK